MKIIRFLLFLLLAVSFSLSAWAHPMPNSILLLDVKQKNIAAELKIPLKEMQFAVPFDVTKNTETLIHDHYTDIANYLIAHIHPQTETGEAWTVAVTSMQMGKDEQTTTGIYKELTVFLTLTPPRQSSDRKLTLFYDVIVHQLVTHKTLVAIRQDFDNGKLGDDQTQVGVISMNPATNQVPPLIINIEQGSNWKGFVSMFNLGIRHIAEGTDHLLFLLVLLLPATLLVKNKRWATFGGTKYSVIKLIKIATSFTIGHSITLLLGAMGWVRLPQQPVEVLIAVTILVTAIHALRPIFPGKEVYIASGFGLIHGLAFAAVLSDLQLEPGIMALSILGFNIGIECMQLFVIIITIPWLIILSNYRFYKWIRITGAIFAIVAALGWITERCTQKPNIVSEFVQNVATQATSIILVLACSAVLAYLYDKAFHKNKSTARNEQKERL